MKLGFLCTIVVLLIATSLTPAAEVWPDRNWTPATPGDVGLDATKLTQARDYALAAAPVTSHATESLFSHGAIHANATI